MPIVNRTEIIEQWNNNVPSKEIAKNHGIEIEDVVHIMFLHKTENIIRK